MNKASYKAISLLEDSLTSLPMDLLALIELYDSRYIEGMVKKEWVITKNMYEANVRKRVGLVPFHDKLFVHTLSCSFVASLASLTESVELNLPFMLRDVIFWPQRNVFLMFCYEKACDTVVTRLRVLTVHFDDVSKSFQREIQEINDLRQGALIEDCVYFDNRLYVIHEEKEGKEEKSTLAEIIACTRPYTVRGKTRPLSLSSLDLVTWKQTHESPFIFKWDKCSRFTVDTENLYMIGTKSIQIFEREGRKRQVSLPCHEGVWSDVCALQDSIWFYVVLNNKQTHMIHAMDHRANQTLTMPWFEFVRWNPQLSIWEMVPDQVWTCCRSL